MTNEDIQKAAEDARRSSAETLTTHSAHQYLDDIPFIKLSYDEIAESAFVKGAKWRINSVWHPVNEEPVKPIQLLLIERKNGEFNLVYRFNPAITKRWAYVKDLIPISDEMGK